MKAWKMREESVSQGLRMRIKTRSLELLEISFIQGIFETTQSPMIPYKSLVIFLRIVDV